MAEAASTRPPRQRRQLRNYLLDRRFQLKYAGYFVAIAAILSGSLGLLLWRTSDTLVEQSLLSVQRGQQAVSLGRQLADESRKVNEVVQMNIVKDPVYADNPELLAAFEDDSKKNDEKLASQQATLEQQATALQEQSDEIARQQQTMLITLLVALLLLVMGIAIVGIIITHRIAGPIYKMTRQIRALGEMDWSMPQPLRKGDELEDFFGAFDDTVRKLRDEREADVELLRSALDELTGDDGSYRDAADGGAAALESLEKLSDRLQEPLSS